MFIHSRLDFLVPSALELLFVTVPHFFAHSLGHSIDIQPSPPGPPTPRARPSSTTPSPLLTLIRIVSGELGQDPNFGLQFFEKPFFIGHHICLDIPKDL
ncbi:hypothetical protein NL676_008183 [Syzygium grande]|nr:hypothetical protein NL676_008183 [Syzygium grande]